MKLCYGLILVLLVPWLAACDQLGYESPAAGQARAEAEGKAIGSACRQTGRALEDCYQINRRAPKAAIFAGWREMDGYMRENKIEEVKPESSTTPPPRSGKPLSSAEEAVPAQQQASEAATAKPEVVAKAPETVAKKSSPPPSR